MYMIGDKIYYPVYGAGIIKNIEDKFIYGDVKKYYIVDFLISGIDLMIPYDFKDSKKIRKVITVSECDKVYDLLSKKSLAIPEKWTERNKLYNKCIVEGDIFSLSSVLKSISELIINKASCKSERKTFVNILKLVSSELAISMDKNYILIQKDILNLLKLDEEYFI